MNEENIKIGERLQQAFDSAKREGHSSFSVTEKEIIRQELMEMTNASSIPAPTATGTNWFSYFNMRFAHMPAVLALFVLVGAGISFAAEGALPGDALYSVKTGINENLIGLFNSDVKAQANWQTELAERRIEEANVLKAQGKLDQDTEVGLAKEVESHANNAWQGVATLVANGETEAAVDVRSNLEQALSVHSSSASAGGSATAAISADAKDSVRADYMRENTLEATINKLEVKIESETYSLPPPEQINIETNIETGELGF